MPTQYTIEEIGNRAKQKDARLSKFSDKEIGDRLVQRNPQLQSVVKPSEPEKGFLRKTAEAIVKPLAEVGTSAVNLGESVFDLARGDVKGSLEAQNKTRNVPFLGETKPAFKGYESDKTLSENLSVKNNIKPILGYGLEVGSTVVGGAGAPGLLKTTLGGAVKQGAKQGLITGLVGGAAQGSGSELSQGNSVVDAIEGGVKGGLIGGVTGGVLGGAGATLGKGVQVARQSVEVAKQPIKTVSGFIGNKANSLVEGTKGFFEKAPVNIAEAKATSARLKVLPESGRKALRSGVLERDINLVREANPETLGVFKKMLGNAKDFAENRSAEDPASVVGNVFRSRIDELEKIREESGKKLGKLVEQFSKDEGAAMRELGQIDAKNFAVKRMSQTQGLQGISMDSSGKLDFSKTNLAGSLTKKDRDVIQKAFSDIDKKDTLGLHKLRQELFEILGGKKRANVELNATQEQGLEAIREGVSDLLDLRVPGYKKSSAEYREVMQPLKELRRFFKNVEGADEDILDMRAAQLARRLTSNVQSKGEISQIVRTIEEILSKKGKASQIDVERLQDFLNALQRYYDVTGDTTFAGQVGVGVSDLSKEGILKNIFKEGFSTETTRRKSFEDFIGSLSEKNTVQKTFERAPDLSPQDRIIESKAFDQIERLESTILSDYKNKYGKIVNTDNFRPFFKDAGYAGHNAASVQEPASYLAKIAFTDGLKNKGKYATYTSGMSGAGKTSALKLIPKYGKIEGKSAVVLDSNLSSLSSALKKFQQAEEAGKKNVVFYTYRDLEDGFINGVVKRMIDNPEEMGRIVPTKVIAENAPGSMKVAQELDKRGYKVYVVDNSLGRGKSKLSSFDEILKKANYSGDLKNKLDNKIRELYEQGTIDERQYKAYIE